MEIFSEIQKPAIRLNFFRIKEAMQEVETARESFERARRKLIQKRLNLQTLQARAIYSEKEVRNE